MSSVVSVGKSRKYCRFFIKNLIKRINGGIEIEQKNS